MFNEQQFDGLRKHAEQRRIASENKAIAAIEKLKASGTKINFETISRTSGVSRSTLYNNKIIRAKITEIRETSTGLGASVSDAATGIQLQLSKLRAENQKLKNDKAKLIVQLMQLEDLKEENERLRKLLRK